MEMENGTTEIVAVDETQKAWDAINTALIKGDLAKLSAKDKHSLYVKTCESVGLNHLTKPFGYITLNGKEVLYATRNCTDQLCKLHGISIVETDEKFDQETRIYTVKVKMVDRHGRTGINRGDLFIPKTLTGEPLANAYMKCHTKALRRCTLSMVGLSFLDETEVESIPGASKVETIQIKEADPQKVPATDAEKKGLFAAFSEKVKSIPDLKARMSEQFPGIDSRTITKVKLQEVQSWISSL